MLSYNWRAVGFTSSQLGLRDVSGGYERNDWGGGGLQVTGVRVEGELDERGLKIVQLRGGRTGAWGEGGGRGGHTKT